jgi:hypothetical protein
MTHRYTTQVASDVDRDGVGVELLSESGAVVAEVLRGDRDHTVLLNTFGYDLPLEAVEMLIVRAKAVLEPFEDGAPLGTARLVAPKRQAPPRIVDR